jgi:hypothetical protein
LERVFTDADRIAVTFCFTLAALTAIAYARWHTWWKTGFGRSRMVFILAFAGLTMERTARLWAGAADGSTLDLTLGWIRITAATAAGSSLLYMLASIIALNIRRVRDPAAATEQGRRHLERTPWASEQEIKELTACWDTLRSEPPD